MQQFKNDYLDFGIVGVDESKKNSSGEVYVKCPQCSPLRKPANQKHKTLAVNVEKGVWKCQHCPWTGGLSPLRSKIETTGLSNIKLDPIRETMVSYWAKRSISVKTLNKCEVRSKNTGITDKDSGNFLRRNCMAFLFRHKGTLLMIKYRDSKKNFAIEKGSKMIPWGLDSIEDVDSCIIVEGEPDRLSYVEAGYDNVVSVPAGTQISRTEQEHFKKTGKLVIESHLNLSYFDSCAATFMSKDVILIGTDGDAAGIKLRMEIGRRFGYEKCKILDYSVYKYKNDKDEIVPCKDANDVLMYFGQYALKETVENAETFKLDDIITVDDIWSELIYQYEHGLIKGKSTMYPDLDGHFTFKIGHPIAINGYPNMGKTSFVLNLIVLTAIYYGWKWGIYSPENYPEVDMYTILFEIVLGNTIDKEKSGRATMDEIKEAKVFIKKHFFLVNREKGYTPEELRSVAKLMIQRYGITGFVKDPWNALNHVQQGNEGLDSYLERELSAEVRFAVNNQIINIVCVHPPTPKGLERKIPEMPSIYEIRGGLIWAAKFYEIISVHLKALTEEAKQEAAMSQKEYDPYENTTQIDVQKVKKQKLVGYPTRGKFIEMMFDRRSNRYKQINGYDPFKKEGKQEILDLSLGEDENFAPF